MSPSPPPVAHTGKKSPTAAAAMGTAAMGTALPEAADLMEGTAPSDYAASTECDTLQGKTFAQQIHAILAMPHYSSIISWNDAGTVVIIHDVDAFISTIMPAHFEHSQWGSFTRRMRRWGFRVANQRSSTPPTASERGQSNVMEFSSENFLRDQPDLCLLMKDERQVKKKFTFLDRNVRRVGGGVEHGTQGSSDGVSVPHPPSSSRGGTVMPSSENKPGGSMTPPSAKNLPLPVHYPPSPSSTLNTAKNQPDSQSEVPEYSTSTVLKSTGDDDLNVAMNVGYPQHYETSVPPMISPNVHSFPMPMMNTMPAQPPLFNYPPYGYGAPPPQGPGFWPVSPAFQYSYAPCGYPPPYPQPQLQPQQQQQQQRQRLSTIHTRASASAASASAAQLLSSSSEESPRNEFDLLPSKKHSNERAIKIDEQTKPSKDNDNNNNDDDLESYSTKTKLQVQA